MKKLRYFAECKMLSASENGDAVLSTALCEVETAWSEANEAIAKKEAWGGAYTVEDDGAEETVVPTAQDDTDAMLIDHEYRLTLLELDVTE